MVQRATPNGNGKKNRSKTLPATSPDARFRSRTLFGRFWGSGWVPKFAKNVNFHVCARPLERNFSQHACRSHSERQTRAKITKHGPKFVEKAIEHGPHYETGLLPAWLQNAGVRRQTSGINSEEKRWQAICRASHLRVRRSRASVLNK